MAKDTHDIPVLIVGGGPVGLTLAMELQHQGIKAVLCERNLQTTRHPKMDITNGRSMELFRRLGYSGEIRKAAIPDHHPFEVVWATGLSGWELARFSYPTVRDMWTTLKADRSGSLPVEPNMRVSQVVIEPVLKNILERDAKLIDLRYGWQLDSFKQDVAGVNAVLRHIETGERKSIRSKYLIGCDGARSSIRRGLGIEMDFISVPELLTEAGGLARHTYSTLRGVFQKKKVLSTNVYVIHFISKDIDKLEKFGKIWHLQMPRGSTLISQNDKDSYTLHIPLELGQKVETLHPMRLLQEVLGTEIEADIYQHNIWALQLGMAQSFGKDRVWLAGDSAHQMIPAGGYGMNTGVGDAVALGWVLGAIIKGWGGENLLHGYNIERRSVAERNLQASKRHMAVRVKISQAETPDLRRPTPKGKQARENMGTYIDNLGNLENEALGIEIGYSYDTSPLICNKNCSSDYKAISRGGDKYDAWKTYIPTTRPGSRPPNIWMTPKTALFDLFDPAGFTILMFEDIDIRGLKRAAKSASVPLVPVKIDDSHIQALYGFDLVIIRPDQHVAWRGNTLPEDVHALIDIIRGART